MCVCVYKREYLKETNPLLIHRNVICIFSSNMCEPVCYVSHRDVCLSLYIYLNMNCSDVLFFFRAANSCLCLHYRTISSTSIRTNHMFSHLCNIETCMCGRAANCIRLRGSVVPRHSLAECITLTDFRARFLK